MNKPYGLKWFIFLSILSLLNTLGAAFLFAILIKFIPALSGLLTPGMQLSTALFTAESIVGLIAIYKRSIMFYYVLLAIFVARIAFVMYQLMETTPDTLMAFALSILLLVFELWYFVQVKSYFSHPKSTATTPQVTNADKKVNIAIVAYIIAFIALAIFGLKGSMETRSYNKAAAVKYVTTLEGKSFKERNDYCLSLDAKEKDTCLLVAFSLTKNLDNITPEHCKLLTLENNIIVCYAQIHRCDLVDNGQKKTACELAQRAFDARAADKK